MLESWDNYALIKFPAVCVPCVVFCVFLRTHAKSDPSDPSEPSATRVISLAIECSALFYVRTSSIECILCYTIHVYNLARTEGNMRGALCVCVWCLFCASRVVVLMTVMMIYLGPHRYQNHISHIQYIAGAEKYRDFVLCVCENQWFCIIYFKHCGFKLSLTSHKKKCVSIVEIKKKGRCEILKKMWIKWM